MFPPNIGGGRKKSIAKVVSFFSMTFILNERRSKSVYIACDCKPSIIITIFDYVNRIKCPQCLVRVMREFFSMIISEIKYLHTCSNAIFSVI